MNNSRDLSGSDDQSRDDATTGNQRQEAQDDSSKQFFFDADKPVLGDANAIDATLQTKAHETVSPDQQRRLPVTLEPTTRHDSLGRLGHYEVLNIIGRGGMGVVARAFDEQLHRNVAIKVMSDRLMTSERARKRFLREARAAASVNHPNVVTIHAVAQKDGIPYLVMEFVDGQSLLERINNDAPMCYEDVLRIGAQIASGLAAAHRHGIIHRDVKPGNVMLEDGIERVKLSDFGLARLLVENSDLTSMGDMVGTPSYMSPEQVDGEELTEASDLFSLGCVLYAMFRGRSPFQAGSTYASAARVRGFEPPPVSSFVEGIPPEFDQLMSTLFSKHAKGRPKTAKQVADLLLQWSAQSHQQRMPSHRLYPLRPRPWYRLDFSSDTTLKWIAAVLLLCSGSLIFAAIWLANRPEITADQVAETTEPTATEVLADGIIDVGAADGEVATFQEAVGFLSPNTLIRFSGERHFGPFELFDPVNHAGVTFQGKKGTVLVGPAGEPVVRISGVPDVKLRGIEVRASGMQIAMRVSGQCPGLSLKKMHFVSNNPAAHRVELVRFDFGASGTKASPIVIEECQFDSGAVGLVIGSHDATESPVRHLHVHHNHLHGESLQYGIPLVIQGQVRSVLVERNWLSRGKGGMSFLFPVSRAAEHVVVRYNTISQVDVGLYLNGSELDQDFRFDDNLIVDASALHTVNRPISEYFQWFAENQWIKTTSLATPEISQCFYVESSDVVKSLDPNASEYLEPANPDAKVIAGFYARSR
ncbi:serine/threonine-protein kinase [Roseiconus lacunae]|uniref:serine/threonine-protein kinase n=1 Tax=Roseiconus lacunae TaxID=2605694 RepID=UPI0011F1F69B|nr:serine/threonine-protein kinase [Roseiconus lacunae]